MAENAPRRFHDYLETDLGIYLPRHQDDRNRPGRPLAWWKVQCHIRFLSANGSLERIQARLLRHNLHVERGVRVLRHHLEEIHSYVTTEDDIGPLLGPVFQPTLERPVVFKVVPDLRHTVIQACEARGLHPLEVTKPAQCIDSRCLLVVGRDHDQVSGLARWLDLPQR